MRKHLFALVCLVVGCAAGSVIPTSTAQTPGATSNAQQWQQFCDFEAFEQMSHLGLERNRSRFNQLLAHRGREGWEYVGPVGGDEETPCFRRPVWR